MQDLLRAYVHFINELGTFPGGLEFAIVPQGDIQVSLTLLTLYHLVISIIDLEYEMQEN